VEPCADPETLGPLVEKSLVSLPEGKDYYYYYYYYYYCYYYYHYSTTITTTTTTTYCP